jgi:hypothetical protein
MSPEAISLPLHTKVAGPVMPAKHVAPTTPKTGSLVVRPGVTALQPDPGFLAAAATTNSGNAVARSPAVELAPLR